MSPHPHTLKILSSPSLTSDNQHLKMCIFVLSASINACCNRPFKVSISKNYEKEVSSGRRCAGEVTEFYFDISLTLSRKLSYRGGGEDRNALK